jgi:hypothetical protein
MIVINTESFIVLGEDSMTPKKAIKGIVKFQTPTKGEVMGWVTLLDSTDSEVANALITNYSQDYFVGEKVNILETLTNEFVAILENLNPSITFEVIY